MSLINTINSASYYASTNTYIISNNDVFQAARLGNRYIIEASCNTIYLPNYVENSPIPNQYLNGSNLEITNLSEIDVVISSRNPLTAMTYPLIYSSVYFPDGSSNLLLPMNKTAVMTFYYNYTDNKGLLNLNLINDIDLEYFTSCIPQIFNKNRAKKILPITSYTTIKNDYFKENKGFLQITGSSKICEHIIQ
jgi:hypothetical protein